MKVDERADGTLVVSYDGSSLTKFMLAAMAVFLATAAYDVFIGTRGTDRLVGLLGASATCLLVSVVFLETARFEFAAPTHLITWRRRWGLRERSGTMPFGAIQSVAVERPMGDDGTPSRRITLRMIDGAVVPLTVGYRPDSDGAILTTANRIRVALGQKAEEMPVADAAALVATGQLIEAIKVLRETESISLKEAKRRVDEIKRKASSR
jgi:hypothetical protein